MKSNRALLRNQVAVIYSRAILVSMTSECRVKRVIRKTWTGTLANSADQIRRRGTRVSSGSALFAYITGSIGLTETALIPRSGPFSQSILKTIEFKCCQCFDLKFVMSGGQFLRGMDTCTFSGQGRNSVKPVLSPL